MCSQVLITSKHGFINGIIETLGINMVKYSFVNLQSQSQVWEKRLLSLLNTDLPPDKPELAISLPNCFFYLVSSDIQVVL